MIAIELEGLILLQLCDKKGCIHQLHYVEVTMSLTLKGLITLCTQLVIMHTLLAMDSHLLVVSMLLYRLILVHGPLAVMHLTSFFLENVREHWTKVVC